MKRTDLERRDRELKRAQKKEEIQLRRSEKKKGPSVGDFIKELSAKFFHDENKIYNLTDDNILDVLQRMKQEIEQKNWENILRKAIKKTGINQKEATFNELKKLLDSI